MKRLLLLIGCVIPLASLFSCGNPAEFDAYDEYRFEVGRTAFIAEGLEDVCVLPDGEFLIVTSPEADFIHIVSVEDLEIVRSIWVPDPHQLCAYTRLGKEYVLVSCPSMNSVALIDVNNHSYLFDIEVGFSPMGICVLPDSEYAYVANLGDSSITVIRTMTGQVTGTIPCDPQPFSICADPLGEYVFCSISDSLATEPDASRLQIVRTSDNTLIGQIPIGQDIRGISCAEYQEAVSPERLLIAADHARNRLQALIYDPPDVEGSYFFTDASAPLDACAHPSGYLGLVTCSGSNSVVVYYTDSEITETIPVEASPTGICSDESGDHVYVVHDSGYITVLDRQ